MDISSLIRSLERAENDNRKFALLLILSELMKSNKLDELKPTSNTEDNEACRGLNKKLFNSIGSHFLARLITTKQTVENCSPLIFKSIAFSILTQFLDYPELIFDPILISKIDIICEVILLKSHSSDNSVKNENETAIQLEEDLVLDVFKYLFALSSYCPEHLIQSAGLLDILMHKVILNENYNKAKRLEFEKKNLHEQDPDILACKLFMVLCKETLPSTNNFKNETIENCLKSLLKSIRTNDGLFKFCLINYLNMFLEDDSIRTYFTTENIYDFSAENLFNILNDLFRSKISRTFRTLAFKLLNNFVKSFQFEYIYMKNRNFFYFIIHLLCIEIGFTLEEANKESNRNHSILLKDLADIISVYYGLLEEIIIILSTASPFDDNEDITDEDENDMAPKTDQEYEPELKKAIKIIVESLETIIMYVKDSLEDFTQLKENELVLQIASIRLLICWLAHETLLDEKLIELMPKLIQFGEYYDSLDIKENKVNIFQFLSPGLQRYLIDLEEKQTVLQNSKQIDVIKSEFEKSEINDQINSINKMLQKCNIHNRN